MKTTTTLAFFSLALCCASTAYADTFGSVGNLFDIEFVTIGNPGNAADTTGDPTPPHPTGSVDYTYRISKFEISEDMINKANTLGGLGITHNNRGANKPTTAVTWFEAAQFVNWLNIDSGSTEAYKFDGSGNFQLWQSGDPGYNPANLYRNSLATYFLPSVDEWYKAAFYDPTSGVYYDFATGSDTTPTAIASGTSANTAVYGQSLAAGPADITLAGGLSPYGTMGQGGNIFEWMETDPDLVNDSISSDRVIRGGDWNSFSLFLLSSKRDVGDPATQNPNGGFRVASIPEPTTCGIAVAATLCLAMVRYSFRQKLSQIVHDPLAR